MSTLCAQVWRRGEWQFTACLNDDHPLGREQLAQKVNEQFPGLPSRLVKEGDDGRLMVIKGACTGGCGCNGRTCKGRAEDTRDAVRGDESWRDGHAGNGNGKKPKRDRTSPPAADVGGPIDEAVLEQILAVVEALLHLGQGMRGKELYDLRETARGMLRHLEMAPATMDVIQARKGLEVALSITSGRRRRNPFLSAG